MKDIQYVFLDSGIGGLPYLKHLQKFANDASIVYIADTKNFPYGEKKTSNLKKLALDLVTKVVKLFNPKLIVIACNTLSLASLKLLRKRFTIPFVGTVPAIKIAAKESKTKTVLIASKKTVKDKYTKALIEKFSDHKKFILKAEQKLIKKIENGLFLKSELKAQKEVKPIIDFCIKNNADCLILGCTHFLLIKDAFEKVANNEIKIIDSLDGVTKQVLKLSPKTESDGNCFFYTTSKCNKEENLQYQKICEHFNLHFKGFI